MTSDATTTVPMTDPAEPAGDATVAVASSDLGDILVDADGMTLYQFDNDSDGTSAYTGDCLGNGLRALRLQLEEQGVIR